MPSDERLQRSGQAGVAGSTTDKSVYPEQLGRPILNWATGKSCELSEVTYIPVMGTFLLDGPDMGKDHSSV